MSKLDELIVELCPNGVEFFKIKDICYVSRGVVISKQDIIENFGEFPVYSSQTENNGELGKINTYAYDGEYLTWTTDGANAGTVFYRIGKFNVTNVCGILKLTKQDTLMRYIYHILRVEAPKYVRSGMGNPKLMSNVMGDIIIPIPPLPIQQEIVRILDTFTELTAELTAELAARKKQYEYYREYLFNLGNEKHIPMGDESIGHFIRGSGLQKKDFTETGVGCIHYGQIYTHYGVYTNKTKTFVSKEFAKKARKARYGNLVIATTSENDEDVCKAVAWLGDEEIAVSSDACFFVHNLNPKYVAYFFQTEQFQKQKRVYITGTKVRRVNVDNLAKIEIPIPSLAEQERIVAILDKFDALTNSISEGLPREIELRQQQYEYYRNMLLNFPKQED